MSKPYCDSYYAATRNDDTAYPALAGETRADVCIIGGGFTGVASALTLAERGFKVVLLEQHRIGWGASGRNGGQVIGGLSGWERLRKSHGAAQAQLIWDIAWRGHEIIRERIARHGIDCDFRTGYVDVAIKPRHLREQASYFDDLQDHGFGDDAVLLDRAALREICPSDAYIGGLLIKRNGHLHPLNLVRGEARAAADLGVSIHENSDVLGIDHATRTTVRTAQGQVHASTVILAGGSYHQLERQHLGGLVFPANSFIIATEPLGELAAEINPLGAAFCDPNYVLDYFRVSGDGRLLFGGRCNYSGRVPTNIEANLRPRMERVFPQLRGRRVDYAWGGRIGIVVNRVPLFGRIGPNVYYAQGYSGHGVNFSHVAAEILADAIAGQLERFDLFNSISHTRIPFGQALGSQMVALGMLYFRMKDLL